MIRQSAPMSINSTAGYQFMAHATATSDGVRVIVAEEYDNNKDGLDDFALMQARMLSAEVFERHFTWDEFAAFSSLSAAGACVLSENGINQWV
jgi:hypothetical protein